MTSLKYTLAEKSHIIIYPVSVLSVVILLVLLTLSYPNFALNADLQQHEVLTSLWLSKDSSVILIFTDLSSLSTKCCAQ